MPIKMCIDGKNGGQFRHKPSRFVDRKYKNQRQRHNRREKTMHLNTGYSLHISVHIWPPCDDHNAKKRRVYFNNNNIQKKNRRF